MPKTQSKQEKHRKAAREKDPEYDEKRKLAEQERRKKQKLVKLEAAAAAPSAAGTPATTTPAPCCSCGCGSAPSITTSVTGPSKADAAAAAALSQLDAVSQLDKANEGSEGSEASDDDEHRPVWSMSEYKQHGERCRQYGREAAADKHTFKDEKVVRVLQRQLMNAAHTIEELAETLEEERLQHKQLNPAAHHVDRAHPQHERLELVRDAAESFETVAFESLEELRVRALASEAVWGA